MTAIQPLQPSEPVPVLTNEPYHKNNTNVLSADALSKITSTPPTSFQTSKPILEPPKRLVEFAVLESIEKLHAAGTGQLQLNMAGLDDCQEKSKEINAQTAAMLKESAKRTQHNNVWTLLKKIGGVVLAAVSTVLGISLLSSGAATFIGGAMIASGIVTLANLAFTETHVWDWVAEKLARENEDKQKKIAVLLPAVVGLVSAVVGLAGSSGAILWASLNTGGKILIFFQTAINMLEGVTSIGEGVTKYRSLKTQSEIFSVKQKLFTNQNAIEKFTGGVKRFLEHQNPVLDE
ncbi:MAG TPA: hypothetical protein VLG49_00950, partial [Rhabdochlamydiaceae bacterium]|nr:hypothetical protein [Rhabdochlamydiaceae bacterium]